MKQSRVQQVVASGLLALMLSGCGLVESGGSGSCDGEDYTGESSVNSSSPHSFALLNDELIFIAVDRGTRKVLTYDGSGRPDAVSRIARDGLRPNEGFTHDGEYYFAAYSQNNEHDLLPNVWRWDGVEHESAAEPWPPRQSFYNAEQLIAFGDNFYFVAWNRAVGTELYRLTPTGEVTLTADLPDGPPATTQFSRFGSNPKSMTVFGDVMLLNAGWGRLYAFDGITFDLLETNLYLGDATRVEFDEALYFAGGTSRSGAADPNLYRYQTGEIAIAVPDIFVTDMMEYEGQLYIVSNSDATDTLWRWDGTGELEELVVSESGLGLTLIGVLSGEFYYATGDQIHRLGAVPTSVDTALWAGDARTPEVFEFEGALYYAGTDQDGSELWSFDGESSEQVSDLHPGFTCEGAD
jgi:hypothetical protein